MNPNLNLATFWITAIVLMASNAFAQSEHSGNQTLNSPVKPNDTFYKSSGSWGQIFSDQWALHHLSLYPASSTTQVVKLHPVTVAVIDTGLDFLHPDMDAKNIWRNNKETLNGKDDDGNGFVDDVIGWNFVDGDNNPWDFSGHGTHISGIIAANTNNNKGIAGINPAARIMSLKVANFAGNARSSSVAAAIYYATDMGARLINLSLAGFSISKLELDALNYAHENGVLVIAAAGNRATSTSNFGYGAVPHVLTVVATDSQDQRTLFSNYGFNAQLSAPGTDILSLRARNTDFILLTKPKKYQAGDAFVGNSVAYYRASGTSFATGIVTGVASRLVSIQTQLTAQQLRNKLLQSATDLNVPGVDQLTGYGLLNPQAALEWRANEFIVARIRKAEVIFNKDEKVVLRISGDANANNFKYAKIDIATTSSTDKWLPLSKPFTQPVNNGVLIEQELTKVMQLTPGHYQWILRLVAEDQNGTARESRFVLTLPVPKQPPRPKKEPVKIEEEESF